MNTTNVVYKGDTHIDDTIINSKESGTTTIVYNTSQGSNATLHLGQVNIKYGTLGLHRYGTYNISTLTEVYRSYSKFIS